MQAHPYPQFLHHGATSGVTGSCHHLIADAHNHLLVDCGLFQGEDEGRDAFDQHAVDFDISHVKALVVTHVHIDHIGRLPYLFAAGYEGPIICSIPSAKLLPLVIEDALKVGFSWNQNIIQRFLDKVEAHLVPLDYNTWHRVVDADGVAVKLPLVQA